MTDCAWQTTETKLGNYDFNICSSRSRGEKFQLRLDPQQLDNFSPLASKTAMHKLLTKLCGKGTTNTAKERKSTQPRSTSAEPRVSLPPPSPPHELPALDFSTPPIGQLEVQRSAGQPTLAPSTNSPTVEPSSPLNSSSLSPPSLPQLETSTSTTTPASFVIPPTPIESSPLARTSTPPSLSDSSSPPPVASTSSLQPVYSSPTTSTHLIPPPSPRPSLSPRSGSPVARRGGGHHRRSSSTGSRSFRETLNAYAVEDANGQRCVNQYIIGQTQGPLGRGTYAVVEKAGISQLLNKLDGKD